MKQTEVQANIERELKLIHSEFKFHMNELYKDERASVKRKADDNKQDRKRYVKEQLDALESVFLASPYPSESEKLELQERTQLTRKQIDNCKY